jgi:hypothetical protein
MVFIYLEKVTKKFSIIVRTIENMKGGNPKKPREDNKL